MDNLCAGILAAGETRARRIPVAVCNERATKPAVKRPSTNVHVILISLLSSGREGLSPSDARSIPSAPLAGVSPASRTLVDGSPSVIIEVCKTRQCLRAFATVALDQEHGNRPCRKRNSAPKPRRWAAANVESLDATPMAHLDSRLVGPPKC